MIDLQDLVDLITDGADEDEILDLLASQENGDALITELLNSLLG